MADYGGTCCFCRKSYSRKVHVSMRCKCNTHKDPLEQRKWAELPHDVLSIVFKKITSVDILRSAQCVCRTWRRLSFEPEIWRRISVPGHDRRVKDSDNFESVAVMAMKRSQGCVEELHLENFTSRDDNFIFNLCGRATKLRSLRLIGIFNISETAFAKAIIKFPMLEELETSFCFLSSKIVEVVGKACPQLKTFRLNEPSYECPYDYYRNYDEGFYSDSNDSDDEKAFSIAKHMQQLQCLQLMGNCFTKIGLLAILRSCPNLQCLDIRECCHVKFDENLRTKCEKIKEFRRPSDFT